MKVMTRRTTGRQAVPLMGLAPGLRRLHSFKLPAEPEPGATHHRLVLADGAAGAWLALSEGAVRQEMQPHAIDTERR
jgi:hypothetical protein